MDFKFLSYDFKFLSYWVLFWSFVQLQLRLVYRHLIISWFVSHRPVECSCYLSIILLLLFCFVLFSQWLICRNITCWRNCGSVFFFFKWISQRQKVKRYTEGCVHRSLLEPSLHNMLRCIPGTRDWGKCTDDFFSVVVDGDFSSD